MVSLLMSIVAQRSWEEGESLKPSSRNIYCDAQSKLTYRKLFRYAKYVKERGEVEREYARALRKLVAR